MKIYIDADACPKPIKEILYKAAQRTKITLILVANQPLTIPASPYIKRIQVAAGFDVADNYIADVVVKHDLVITADIPLADAVVKKQAFALNPRGELYTEDNIKQRLATRNLMDELRSGGMQTGGPKMLSAKDKQAFANALDKYINRFKT